MNDRVATGIAIVITVVWLASLVLDATWQAYDPPGTVHALMMAVAGWAFGERYLRRGETGQVEEPPPDRELGPGGPDGA